MKKFRIVLLISTIPLIFSCSEADELTFCDCYDNLTNKNVNKEMDKECNEKFKDMTNEELMKEMEQCGEDESSE